MARSASHGDAMINFSSNTTGAVLFGHIGDRFGRHRAFEVCPAPHQAIVWLCVEVWTWNGGNWPMFYPRLVHVSRAPFLDVVSDSTCAGTSVPWLGAPGLSGPSVLSVCPCV